MRLGLKGFQAQQKHILFILQVIVFFEGLINFDVNFGLLYNPFVPVNRVFCAFKMIQGPHSQLQCLPPPPSLV